MLKNIVKITQTLATIGAPANGAAIPLDKVKSVSAQIDVTVNTPSAKTVDQDTGVNVGTDVITATATTGYSTGLVVQLTSTGTLPAGLALATNYYVIVVSATTFKLASSLVLAQAGTAVNITDTGTAAATMTVTATALASGQVQLQKSNDGVSFYAQGTAVSVTATGTIILDWVDPTTEYVRVAYSLASGSFSASTILLTKGEM